MENTPTSTPPKQTVHKNASWGAIISIVIILAMVIIGAFYAWGQRVAEEQDVQQVETTSAS